MELFVWIKRNPAGDRPLGGRLTSGNFYAAGEGLALQKVRIPMCLSCHPPVR
jgi:hypothetical protein